VPITFARAAPVWGEAGAAGITGTARGMVVPAQIAREMAVGLGTVYRAAHKYAE